MIAELRPGDLLGEAALLTGKPTMGTAQALTDVQLWSLEKADFDELSVKHPRFVPAITRALSERSGVSAVAEARPSKPEKIVHARPATVTGLADNLEGSLVWLVSRSAGVKLRLAVVGFLVLWLCGITFPATVISSVPLQANDLLAVFQTPLPTEAPSSEPIAMSVPTDTPMPTETPRATPTEVQSPETETPVTLAMVPTDTPTPVPPTSTPTREPPTPAPPPLTPTGTEATRDLMGSGGVPTPMLTVLDADGLERDLAWVQRTYGSWIEFGQPAAGGCFRIVELRQRIGPSNIDVWVLDENGEPVSDMMLRFDWPGGETEQATNRRGRVGFGLGMGSYIYNSRFGGPHTIRVMCEYPSDVARNFGMLAGTNHDHLDVVFQFVPTRG